MRIDKIELSGSLLISSSLSWSPLRINDNYLYINPQVVIKDYEGKPASVSYSRITAILIEAIKIQNKQIENLTKRIEVLEK